ncbi:MAG: hypothetical protein R2911_36170 [Caldilineaceae bacterium]
MLTYPPLAYRAAVDWCVAAVTKSESTVALFSSHALTAVEFIKRLPGHETRFYPVGDLREQFQRQEWPPSAEIGWENVRIEMGDARADTQPKPTLKTGNAVNTVVWAGLGLAEQQAAFNATHEMLASGGMIWILQPGRLSFLIPDKRYQMQAAAGAPKILAQSQNLLMRNGYRIEKQVGFYGLTSLFYGFAAGQCQRLQQPQLVDRFQHRMRHDAYQRQTSTVGGPLFNRCAKAGLRMNVNLTTQMDKPQIAIEPATLGPAVLQLDRWLDTMRGPAGYGGPVVHWWQDSLHYAGRAGLALRRHCDWLRASVPPHRECPLAPQGQTGR